MTTISDKNMLSSFRLQNFKSYKDATFSLSSVTIMLGANGSGKSNALEALRIMSRLGRGSRLDDLQSALTGQNAIVRGGVQNLFNSSLAQFEMDYACGTSKEYSLELTLGCKRSPNGKQLYNKNEILRDSKEKSPIYEIAPTNETDGENITVLYNNFNDGEAEKPSIACSNQQVVFYQLLSGTKFYPTDTVAQKRIPGITNYLRNQFTNILFLTPVPEHMRGYANVSGKNVNLSEDGSNVSAVLKGICTDAELKNELMEIIRCLPEQDIQDIRFIETELGDVMVQLIEGFSQKPVPATLLSDGTLRVLAHAAALLSAPQDSMLVFEEIDNGIHPSRVRHILQKVYEYAKKRRLQVIITTHNPALMDAVPREEICNVLYVYRDKDGGSKAIRLGDMDNFPDFIISDGTLGASVTSLKFLDEHMNPKPISERLSWWHDFTLTHDLPD